MNDAQKKALKNRIDSVTKEKNKLAERLSILKKEKLLLERQLRDAGKLLSEIPCPVVLLQGNQIVFANEMAWELSGYTKEELQGLDLLDLVHPKSSDFLENYLKKILASKPFPSRVELYLQKKNGEPLCCDLHWRKIRYQGRTAFLLNMSDLDERKGREAQLRQSYKNMVVTKMAAGVGRDLDKVLEVIDAALSLLRKKETVGNEDLRKRLKGVETGLEMGSRITQQMSCLAKKKNSPLDTELFDPKKAVREAMSIVKAEQKEDPENPIHIKTYLRTLSPVEGHSEEIRDAFSAVISNAADAMPKGGEIYLTTEESAGFARIYIQDAGIGVPDDILDTIFDPFFTTKGDAHAGLGLSLADAVIKRHSGEISVMSQEGQGATFIIKLPLAPRRAKASDTKRKKNKIKDSAILLTSSGNIITDLLTQEFVTKGGRVTEVPGCREAKNLIKRKKFDLVVTDIHTPDFEAADAVSRLKGRKKNLPIVLVNSDNEKKTPGPLKKLGADLIIEPPLNMDRISQDISEIIDRKTASK